MACMTIHFYRKSVIYFQKFHIRGNDYNGSRSFAVVYKKKIKEVIVKMVKIGVEGMVSMVKSCSGMIMLNWEHIQLQKYAKNYA